MRACVRACLCVLERDTVVSEAGEDFFFFSLDLAWFVFNKGQRSGLLWGEGKGHLRWTGQKVPGGQVMGPVGWGRGPEPEPPHLALLLAGRWAAPWNTAPERSHA